MLSSVQAENIQTVLAAVLADQARRDAARGADSPADQQFVEQLFAVATALGDAALPATLAAITRPTDGKFAHWQIAALSGLVEALARRKTSLAELHVDAASLDPLLKFARQTAVDDKAPLAERLAAVRLIVPPTSELTGDFDALAALLAPQTHGDVQAAAVEALGRLELPRATATLLAGWKGYGPALKSKVIDVLLSREHSTGALLVSIGSGDVPPGDVSAAHRQRLLAVKDEKLRSLAARLLAGPANTDRAAVVDAQRDALGLKPDLAAGRETFAKRCSVCHKLADVSQEVGGQAVGPDLAALADKSPEFLLTAMLDPNRAVEARYVDYIAVTDAGQTFTGMLAAETGTSITLVGQQGKSQTILRSQLESLTSSGKSLMPEGLEKDLSKQDLANVIGLLRSTRPPRKEFAGNQPQLIAAGADGKLSLPAAAAEIYGPSIIFEPQYKNLGWWSSVDDQAQWSIDVPQSGKYQVRIDYACDNSTAGNPFVLQSGDKTLAGKVAGTGNWDTYKQTPIGTLELPAGRQTVTFRSGSELHGALIDLRTVELRPEK